MFTVYGLRLRGSIEVRYVGFTKFAPAARLARHIADTTYGTPGRALRQWLLANADAVEAVPLCTAKTEVEARAMEKGAIAACAHAGNQLFNSDHMPRNLPKLAAA